MSPYISIIIPTFNRSHLIGETIDSILAQTFTDWECIVVDDGSTDHTSLLLEFYSERDPRIKYYNRPQYLPKGANACRNYGFKVSNGKYINWFDSDDLMLECHLEKKIQVFKSDLSYCICNSQSFNRVFGKIRIQDVPGFKTENFYADVVLRNLFLNTASILWRKSFLLDFQKEEYLFDERLMQSQDYDFHCRILRKETKFELINEVLFLYRSGEQSISNQFLKEDMFFESYLLVRKKILESNRQTQKIYYGIFNELVSFLRISLGEKKYHQSRAILNTLKEEKNNSKKIPQLNFFKIKILFYVVRLMGRGETFLKPLFKI